MKIITLLLTSLLLIANSPSFAGKIYRFLDDNGVSTLSKSLPPYASQKGYDILDDTSLRLIERVYTREELIKIQKRQALIDQKNDLIKQQRKAEKQKRLEQRVHDRNLIARYPSDQVLIQSRDDDLTYRQGQINDAKDQLKNNQHKLTDLQIKAAELEMEGGELTANLTKRLSATQKEIDNNKLYIQRSNKEKDEVSHQYNTDLKRLKLLLNIISEKPAS